MLDVTHQNIGLEFFWKFISDIRLMILSTGCFIMIDKKLKLIAWATKTTWK